MAQLSHALFVPAEVDLLYKSARDASDIRTDRQPAQYQIDVQSKELRRPMKPARTVPSVPPPESCPFCHH
jgi:hypothetical protein